MLKIGEVPDYPVNTSTGWKIGAGHFRQKGFSTKLDNSGVLLYFIASA